MLDLGSQDYLVKGEFGPRGIERAIRNAINQHKRFSKLQKHASELEEGERKLRHLIVSNADAMLVVDDSKVIRFVNPSAEILFDREKGNLSGEIFKYPIRNYTAQEITIPRNGDGEIFAEMQSVPMEWEETPAHLVTIRDVSDRKRIENSLRKNESLLRSLITSANDAVIVIDSNGDVTMFNPAAEKMFGRRASGIIGGPLDPLMPESYRSRHRKYIRKFFSDEESKPDFGKFMELPAQRSNGEIFPMEISLASDNPGGTRYVVAVARDISQRKQSEYALQKANRKLRELDRMKNEFLSTASHELRTPLTIIGEFAAILRDGIAGELTREQADCVSSILSNTKRLGKLVNEILTLQKIESSRIMINRSRCDLRRLIEQCVNDFMPRFEAAEQKLETEIPDDLLPALCDRDKIMQVLVNIIGNAHKVVPGGGTVEVKAIFDYGDIQVSVSDNGPGIPENRQESIFERFVQLDRKDGPDSRGTGLGLPIAKKIVELHNGTIGVNSLLGEGSTFYFTIPVYDYLSEIKARIEDRYNFLRSKDETLSIGLVRIEKIINGQRGSSVKATREVLSYCREIVQECMRREKDEVLYLEPESMLVVICESSSIGIEAVMRRVLRKLIESLESSYSFSTATMTLSAEEDLDDPLMETAEKLNPVGKETCRSRVLILTANSDMALEAGEALSRSGLDMVVESVSTAIEAREIIRREFPDMIIIDIDSAEESCSEFFEELAGDEDRISPRVLVLHDSPPPQYGLTGHEIDGYLEKPFSDSDLVEKVRVMIDEEVCVLNGSK
jgi:PAS domain S-box-containing protein